MPNMYDSFIFGTDYLSALAIQVVNKCVPYGNTWNEIDMSSSTQDMVLLDGYLVCAAPKILGWVHTLGLYMVPPALLPFAVGTKRQPAASIEALHIYKITCPTCFITQTAEIIIGAMPVDYKCPHCNSLSSLESSRVVSATLEHPPPPDSATLVMYLLSINDVAQDDYSAGVHGMWCIVQHFLRGRS